MKVKIYTAFIILLIIMNACIVNKIDDKHRTISLKTNSNGRKITLELEKGPLYSEKMQAGPIIFNVLPQIALWTENQEGQLLETLYISGADYKKMRHGGKSSKGSLFYKQCLPYWSSKVEKSGGKLPSEENPYPDALTSVTPASSFSLKTRLKKDYLPFNIFLEINKSGDENKVYTKEKNDWVGQPSLIYQCNIDQIKKSESYNLKLIGHGGLIGQEAKIYPDLSNLDSALKQIQSIKIKFD